MKILHLVYLVVKVYVDIVDEELGRAVFTKVFANLQTVD